MSISQTPSHVLFFNDTKLNFRSEGTWGKTLSTWQYNGHSDMTNGLRQWKPHASLSGWHLAVINFQSLFTLLWAPRGDQNRCRVPRKNWHGDFTLAGSGSKAENSHHSRKGPSPGGNTSGSSFLSSDSFKMKSFHSDPKTVFNGIY